MSAQIIQFPRTFKAPETRAQEKAWEGCEERFQRKLREMSIVLSSNRTDKVQRLEKIWGCKFEDQLSVARVAYRGRS